jgi:diaminohydroxyphosphoribosylaminopyrimidine deaminase/5-amino-6-(5-phosphoribosylamino)uracil reductase
MVTLKLAETADGFAAPAAAGPRLLITGAAANEQVHLWRAQHDAIMVGIGTVVADDPLLTVRAPGYQQRRPLRVVLDSRLALPVESRLAMTATEHPTLVVTGEDASQAAALRLLDLGLEVLRVPLAADGHIALAAALKALGSRGLTRVFSEGGPRIAAALITESFADEVILLTGEHALAQKGLPALAPAIRLILADPAHYRKAGATALGRDLCQRYERSL